MNGIGVIAAVARLAIASVFHTLVVQPTSFCNLDCVYCYLPDRRSRRLMTVPVAQACASSIERQGSDHPVSVVWHGGEPTATPISYFQELLAPFESLRRAGRVRHEIQTNATLINQRWCDLFTAHGFAVGVSVDGPGALNRNRLDHAGRSTTNRTLRGIRVLADAGTIAGVEAGRDNTTRIFWYNADVALGARGALLALFDQLDALMRSLHAQKARARDQERQQFGLPPAPPTPEKAAGPAACAGCGPVAVGRWTGREVRALREALRMSVDGFAEHLGVNPATVHGWEHKLAAPPTRAAQSALDRVLTLAHTDVKARFRLLLDTPDDITSWAPSGQDAHAGSSLATPLLPAGRTCPASWHPATAEAAKRKEAGMTRSHDP